MSSPVTGIREDATTLLFCPACVVARPPRRNTAIGAHRTICPICNSFAQRMMKATRQRMKAALTEEQYRRLWQECAVDHYPAVIARWTIEHPGPPEPASVADSRLQAERDAVLEDLNALADAIGVERPRTPGAEHG